MRKQNESSKEFSVRERIARTMKLRDAVTVRDISTSLGITFEAVRKTLAEMRKERLVEQTSVANGRGRPAKRWTLTPLGEQLLPTQTNELLSVILDEITSHKNKKMSRSLFAGLASSKAQRLLSFPEAKTEQGRLELLENIYSDGDEFLSIEKIDGQTMVVEKNCPFIDVSLDHPSICSLTTNVIGEVTGKKVKRAKSFQAGDGMCAFLILENSTWDGFEFETETKAVNNVELDRH